MNHQVAICQPHYIPWIGYFEMIDRVDEFIFLDDVDIIMREWKTRNRIRKECRSSETKWLTVPIERECRRATPIHLARIGTDDSWRRRHLDALRMVYAGTPYYQDAHDLLRAGLDQPAATLADVNIALLLRVCAYLGIDTPLRRASDTPTEGRKTNKLVALCQVHSADHYLANNGSASYLDMDRFNEHAIAVAYQDYEHPTYEQGDGKRGLHFLSHLSVLDLIANHGPDSLAILRQGRPTCAQ